MSHNYFMNLFKSIRLLNTQLRYLRGKTSIRASIYKVPQLSGQVYIPIN